jgi:chemosensory pili system protein ChpA (sensor histidine kinase/response regulator)
MATVAAFDTGSLTWVKQEIDVCLDRAAEALRQLLADGANSALLGLSSSRLTEMGNAGLDREQLALARHHIHQAYGALQIIDFSEGTLLFARCLELLIADVEDDAILWSARVEQALQEGIAAWRNYLDDVACGEPDQPLRLMAAYRDIVAAREQPDPLPSDLFSPDLRPLPPRRTQSEPPLTPEMRTRRLKAARVDYERGLLRWIRNDWGGTQEMRKAVAAIEQLQDLPQDRALWWVASAFFDAAQAGALPDDPLVKRHGARINAQIRRLIAGDVTVSDRLLRDTLYWVAVARPCGDTADSVRAVYDLARHIPPATADGKTLARGAARRSAREQLMAAMEDWSRFCAGTAAALPAFHDGTQRLVARLIELQHADLKKLGAALVAYASQLRKDPLRLDEVAGLEVATALLLIESALDNFSGLGTDFSRQADVVATRLAQITLGHLPASGKTPDLDALNRRATETRLTSFVAREIQANLGVIEQVLDGFFRDPRRRTDLSTIAKPIKQIEGALLVLDQERACDVLRATADQINAFAQGEGVPDRVRCEEVATRLCALGFFAEQLQRGGADIDALLRTAGVGVSSVLPPVVAQPQLRVPPAGQHDAAAPVSLDFSVPQQAEDSPSVQASDQRPDEETAPTLGADALPPPIELPGLAVGESQIKPSAAAIGAPGETALPTSVDPDLFAIFTEEAREVFAQQDVAFLRLKASATDRDALVIMRRGFHTLKGAARMMGLTVFGEMAWAVEDVLNAWLAQERVATPALLQCLSDGQAVLSEGLACMEQGRPLPDASSLFAQSQALKATLADQGYPIAPMGQPASIDPPQQSPAPSAPAGTGQDVDALDEEAPYTPEREEAPKDSATLALDDEASMFAEPLFSLYVEEANQHIAALRSGFLRNDVPSQDVVRAAHTLASISSTARITPVHELAHALENALVRYHRAQAIPDDRARGLILATIDELDAMLACFTRHQLPVVNTPHLAALDNLSPVPQPLAADRFSETGSGRSIPETTAPAVLLSPAPAPAATQAATPATQSEPLPVAPPLSAAHDDIDPQLLPLFLEEAQDLLHAIGQSLRQWRSTPDDASVMERLKRELHTLKGSARMTGAMAMGDWIHQMETRIGQSSGIRVRPDLHEEIEAGCDRIAAEVDRLRGIEPAPLPPCASAPAEQADVSAAALVPPTTPEHPPIPHLRIPAPLIDRLVDEAGEMGIARARIETEMRGLKMSLLELTDNVIRLRHQLREIEIQAETQMQSRRTDGEGQVRDFDPLELDRFTRFQELTRMMAESVNDVSTVQHNLRRSLDHVSGAITAQSRINRELSQSLMGARMVPFNTLADRLHRVIRQTAKTLDRRVSLDIRGGQIEVDRCILDRVTAPLEHLLRNAVVHGIEPVDVRRAAGKPDRGSVDITVTQDGNEIMLTIADDGAGFDWGRIRTLAEQHNLLPPEKLDDPQALVHVAFSSGFSTAPQVSEIAGRGMGMSVVLSEISALGGHLDLQSEMGRGITFRICLPLTLSVLQAVLVRAGGRAYAVAAATVEQATEMKPDDIDRLRKEGTLDWLGNRYPWHYLPHLLGQTQSRPQRALRYWVLLLKGKENRIALEVDAMLGNQEIVVKSIGPQLSRVSGIAGATVLGDGEIALILKPVDLANRMQRPSVLPAAWVDPDQADHKPPPVVLIVDDSLTVRKITSRLLIREGYQVLTAKDGKDALDQMSDLLPDIVLADIEMPRMDGFELARSMRASARLKSIPLIMITSRLAQKHKNVAQEIGVNHYLGKPYDESELLRLLREHTGGAREPHPLTDEALSAH